MDSLLFDGEEEPPVPERVLQNLLIKPEAAKQAESEPLGKDVLPEPELVACSTNAGVKGLGMRVLQGFCLKTWTDQKEKVFINICKCDQIPAPKPITDEQLAALLESGDPTPYRVPLSLGEPHTEKDNAGADCRVFDIIINSSFYETIQERPYMKQFLLTIVLEGLEDKYSIRLSRDCKAMKKRKFLGSLPEQTVRQKPKPFIIEMDSSQEGGGKKSVSESGMAVTAEQPANSVPEPQYTILREPLEGELPEFLVLEVQLPGIHSCKNLQLDVGEDRVVLNTRPRLFLLDIDLPYLVDSEETGAQFNRQSKVLTVTLPVTGTAPV